MDDKDEQQQQQSSSTKVYYHLDDSTPYMSEIPVPADQLTLGDFKRNFVRKGYSYFCKEWDPDLRREVKVEISHDRQLLQKSANGLIELFLLSQNSIGQRGAGTLPKVKIGGKKANEDVPMNHLALSTMATNSEIDVGGGQRVSMATITEASSDVQTLISKRAGENLAAIYNSTSEDPYYNRTSISSSGIFPRLPAPLPSAEESTIESATAQIQKQPQKFRRNGRKQCRKAYVPSTISSESESSYSLPRIEEVKLRLKEAPLGISVASQDGSIFIYHIQPGSAAEKCNQLEIGDQIIQVNETRFEDLNEAQALELLKKLSVLKRTVIMYVAKRKRVNGESSEERKSDALSLLCETQQLDISQWVESTKQNCAEPIQPFMDIPPTEGTSQNALDRTKQQQFLGDHPLMGDAKTNSMAVEMQETSDEEAAAYMDRRNGVGAQLVPALAKAGMEDRRKAQNNKAAIKITNEAIGQAENPSTSRPFLLGLPSTANPRGAAEPSASNSNSALPPRAQQPLHAAMDPKIILRRMVELDSGLTIRNRKWLKIPVPMSFIGDEMVDWLLANVQGFRDRKGVKSFAAKLLQLGLIKHVVNTTAFSQNCYYIFDDEIIASRIAKLEENEGSKKSSVTKPAQQQHLAELGGGNKNAGQNGGAAGPPESTTEITYMSNPSSPFFGPSHSHQIHPLGPSAGGPPQLVIANNPRYVQAPNVLNMLHKNDHPHPIVLDKNNGNSAAAIPLRTLNPPKIGATRLPLWPISPIVPFPTANANSRKECESPEATNEYASMIQGEINCGAQFDAQLDGIGPSPPTSMQKGPLLDALNGNNAQPQQQNASSANNANGNKNSIHQQNPNPIAAPPSVVLLPAPPLPQRQFVPKTQP